MKREEFSNFLNKKLVYLVDSEKEKEINKYISVIDNYKNMGQTEEEAIATFGDPDDLVRAIYLSHGLDYGKLFGATSTKGNFRTALKNFTNNILGTDKSKAGKSLLYVLYLVVLVILLKVVFIFIRDNAEGIFTSISTSNTFLKVYYIIFEVLYFTTGIFLFKYLFTKRFNANRWWKSSFLLH